MKLSLSEAIDSLINTNLKIYHLVDIIQDPEATDKEVSQAARKAQKLNSQRSQLKNYIDEIANQGKEDIKV